MSRLTKKKPELNMYVFNRDVEYANFEDGLVLLQIVGRIEDLEEQLGCPLEVLESALMNGIYTNVYSGLCIVSRFQDVLNVSDDYSVYIKDYKKTWWLSKDKSE